MENPFKSERANALSDEEVLSFYIEDNTYARFIRSKRNIFLVGERGCGKTMALRYNSFGVLCKKAQQDGQNIDFSTIGTHISGSPILHKQEYLLLNDDFRRSITCEHFLVLSIMYEMAHSLCNITEIKEIVKQESDRLFQDFEYILGFELRTDYDFFTAVRNFTLHEAKLTQNKINGYDSNEFYENTMSFSSIIIPFIEIIKSIPIFNNSHFLLMIDDAQTMNEYQIKTLNSWIAYRDHSNFSFKVATTKVDRPKFITSTGGTILEGHDFTSIDMEKPFQNPDSDFYILAKKIVKKRLELIDLNSIEVEDFFPENPEFTKSIRECEEAVRKEAEIKYPNGTAKQINDHIYKYARAKYYRDRLEEKKGKANMPPYSGFKMIVAVSTGIIRNLLEPCFFMFDLAFSNKDTDIKEISYTIQNQIIIEKSKELWTFTNEGLDSSVENCSSEQAKQISQLFNNLMILFRNRLKSHKSEPRAITFTVSQKTTHNQIYNQVRNLLNIARKSQILYTRTSRSKDDGKLETYYIPNRLLFPSFGLDPEGQHAHVSLKATDLWNAAEKNTPIPYGNDSEIVKQKTLFDNYE
ncbi:MAG: hypothetical protein LBC68_12515 [Prevotellaceae bacterium]|jgi:hypothetical protein|nr:hypothetical protein [Prevotellaceae bacterium]